MTTSTVPPNTGLDKVKESAKAYAGLVGTLVTALIAVGVNEPYGYILALIGAAATGISVWAATNTKTTAEKQRELDLIGAELPPDEYEGGYAATVRAETPEGDPEQV